MKMKFSFSKKLDMFLYTIYEESELSVQMNIILYIYCIFKNIHIFKNIYKNIYYTYIINISN